MSKLDLKASNDFCILYSHKCSLFSPALAGISFLADSLGEYAVGNVHELLERLLEEE